MRRYITILRVVKTEKHINNVWKIIRCDEDPSNVGEITGCGVPERASVCPIGTEYKTIFTIK